MVAEAKLEQREGGLAPADEGWFVVNVSEGAWITSPAFDSECVFEAGRGTSFKDVGIAVAVLAPGRPNGLYHREPWPNPVRTFGAVGRVSASGRRRGESAQGLGLPALPAGHRSHLPLAGDGPCVLFDGRRPQAAGDRLSALRACSASRRGRRSRDAQLEGRLRRIRAVAARRRRDSKHRPERRSLRDRRSSEPALVALRLRPGVAQRHGGVCVFTTVSA